MLKLVTLQGMVNRVALLRLWLNRQQNSTEKITEEFLDTIKEIKLWHNQMKRCGRLSII